MKLLRPNCITLLKCNVFLQNNASLGRGFLGNFQSMMIENDHIIDWLRLSRTPSIGPLTFWRLLKRYGAASCALAALGKNVEVGGGSLQLCTAEEAQRELEKAQKLGVCILPASHEDYPLSLKNIPDPPPLLYCWGDISLLKRESIGIVGARNCSLGARRFTEQWAKTFGESNYVVVSGLARGIDKHAHLGALETATVAVVAGGVDVIYPPEHADLHLKIRQKGCIVSEMPIGVHPGATHFPRRNRIISGLSKGIVVIEAALKSGSLITARYALEQGRELFAIPGSPLDPRSQGTNELIRNGAYLTVKPQDVLDVLQTPQMSSLKSTFHPPYLADEKEEYNQDDNFALSPTHEFLVKRLLEDLSLAPLALEVLLEQYNLESQAVMEALLELELTGVVRRDPNGMVVRIA